MPRLPDRFDLWVRKAREAVDPARQVDLVLGALVARGDMYFLNTWTKEEPRIQGAQHRDAADPEDRFAVVFSDAQRLEEFAKDKKMLGSARFRNELPAIVTPMASALDWCVEKKMGLIINPSVGETVMVPPLVLAAFVEEWKQRGGRQAAGFWIPNMTTEEEDFWQENGL